MTKSRINQSLRAKIFARSFLDGLALLFEPKLFLLSSKELKEICRILRGKVLYKRGDNDENWDFDAKGCFKE